MGWESSGVVGFDLGPLLEGQMRTAKLKSAYNLLLLVLEVLVKGQSWGFTSRSTARVILGQVLRIATCGTRTHRGDSL